MTLQTSIETINGKLCTLIHHKQPTVHYLDSDFLPTKHGYELHYGNEHMITALLALPRHPTPKDAPLLYLYLAHSLNVCSTPAWKHGWDLDGVALIQALSCRSLQAITHATDAAGQRHEIAIIKKEPTQ